MKKTAIMFCIVLGLGATVFFIGWVQFAVPIGKYGVMVSKTSGIEQQIIKPGIFRWHWEPILPTNAQIHSFTLDEKPMTLELHGVLPSADLYSKILEGSPSFTWAFTLTINAKLQPEMLPSLVQKHDMYDQDALNKWIQMELSLLSQKVSSELFDNAKNNIEKYRSIMYDAIQFTDEIKRNIEKIDSPFEIITVAASNIRLPDMDLYMHAKDSYQLYQDLKTKQLVSAIGDEAGKSILETLEIERLSQLGEILTRYPILIDYLAVTNGTDISTFKSLRTIPKTP